MAAGVAESIDPLCALGGPEKRHDEAHGAFALAVAGQTPPPLPVVVELVRVSVSKLDDDNAIAALKPLRDACAEWLGCRNDRDPRVTWRTAQAHDAEKELLPVGRRGQTRNAFRCYAVVRIFADPAEHVTCTEAAEAAEAEPGGQEKPATHPLSRSRCS